MHHRAAVRTSELIHVKGPGTWELWSLGVHSRQAQTSHTAFPRPDVCTQTHKTWTALGMVTVTVSARRGKWTLHLPKQKWMASHGKHSSHND
jgi:hypothetical protein